VDCSVRGVLVNIEQIFGLGGPRTFQSDETEFLKVRRSSLKRREFWHTQHNEAQLKASSSDPDRFNLERLALPPAVPRIFAKVSCVGKLNANFATTLALDWQRSAVRES
jgi:hypothetical protein